MPRKGKRRREARRERKEHLRAAQEAPGAGPPPAPPAKAPEPPRHRPERPWKEPARARKKRRGGGLPVNPWLIAAPASVVAVVAIGLFLIMGTGGGSSSPKPSPTVDPRVAGMTPTATYTIEAGGGADNAFFAPNTLTVKAGEVIRIEVTNTGNVSHNLTISGLDKQYDTKDDWESVPYGIKPGEKGTVTFKIDSPGTYPFRCAFHPTVQFGNLVVQP